MLLDYASVIKQFNVNVTGIIHVGGHIGEELKTYKKHNVSNLIVFEPQKPCFDILKKEADSLEFENIQLVNKALGSDFGTVVMYCNVPDGLCSSVLKPKDVYQLDPNFDFSIREEVEMVTLDSVVGEDHNYNFLNMDTQGYELQVLKGSSKTLEKIDYVYTEVNNAELYEGCPMVQDLDEYLGGFNFVRVKIGWGHPTWGDAFYIKEHLI